MIYKNIIETICEILYGQKIKLILGINKTNIKENLVNNIHCERKLSNADLCKNYIVILLGQFD